jgi:hypothetical protein
VLAGYLTLVCFFSPHLGNDTFVHRTVGLRDSDDAAAILAAYEGGTVEEQTRSLLLAAWLNFASGAEEWGTLIDTNGDDHPDLAFCLVLYTAETVLCEPKPTEADLARALAFVQSCFDVPPAPEDLFNDVSPDHLYHDAIEGIAALGIITGFSDGTFRPDEPVTRQQFAKMIVRAMGYEASGADACLYGDVADSFAGSFIDPTDPLYPDHYVAVCVARGITVGKTATTFAPYDHITRQQLITMMARAAALADPAGVFVPSFFRSQFYLDEHYLNACKAASAGLLDGLEGMGPEYSFFNAATRGEVCVLLYNLLHR